MSRLRTFPAFGLGRGVRGSFQGASVTAVVAGGSQVEKKVLMQKGLRSGGRFLPVSLQRHFQRSLSSSHWLILVNGGQGILFWVLREGQAAGYISLLVGGWRNKSIIKAGLNTDAVLWPSLQLLHHSYVFYLCQSHVGGASETKRWWWSQFLF